MLQIGPRAGLVAVKWLTIYLFSLEPKFGPNIFNLINLI
jgi:hypothetical protein